MSEMNCTKCRVCDFKESLCEDEFCKMYHGEGTALDFINSVKASAQPEKRTEERTETHACDLISRQAAIDALKEEEYPCENDYDEGYMAALDKAVWLMEKWLPSAQQEQPDQLTDKEQRIFLAAMDREMEVCEEVDRNYVREPYEDSLVSVCREIKRKVKGALWTI